MAKKKTRKKQNSPRPVAAKKTSEAPSCNNCASKGDCRLQLGSSTPCNAWINPNWQVAGRQAEPKADPVFFRTCPRCKGDGNWHQHLNFNNTGPGVNCPNCNGKGKV